MTREEIMKAIEAENVQFFRLQFVDIFGFMKNVAIPKSQIEKALDGDMMFDGSSIDGFVRIDESDMYLKPDYDTFTLLPWRNKDGVAAAELFAISINRMARLSPVVRELISSGYWLRPRSLAIP